MKYLFFGLFVFLFGCNGNVSVSTGPDSVKQDGTIMNDTTTVTLDTFQKSTKTPAGIYNVILPCPDCKGLEHTVLFNANLTYRLEETALGKQKRTTKTEGLWRANDGKIFLYKNDTVQARYSWQGDTLLYLQPDNHAIALRKLPAATDNPAWLQKGTAGTLFYGVGNEPFWSVEIDNNKAIAFTLADGPKLQPFKKVQTYSSGDTAIFAGTADSATVRVAILNTFCSDGMSDYMYTNKVQVTYKGQVYAGCGTSFNVSAGTSKK